MTAKYAVSTAPLSVRSLCVLAAITRAAQAGAPSPTNADLDAALVAGGFPSMGRVAADGRMRHEAIGYEITRLIATGKIAMIGAMQCRVFEVTGLQVRTTARRDPPAPKAPRAEVGPTAINHLGWPLVTSKSAASYDRAVRYRLFALHEIGVPDAHAPKVCSPAIQPVAMYSLTGCSAAVAAL